jgi:hypothetical protein
MFVIAFSNAYNGIFTEHEKYALATDRTVQRYRVSYPKSMKSMLSQQTGHVYHIHRA